MNEVRPGHKPLDEIVTDMAYEVKDPGGAYTKTFLLRLLISELKDLNFWVIPNYTTVDGQVNDLGCFDLPADCVRPLVAYWKIRCSTTGQDFLLPLEKLTQVADKIPEVGLCAPPPPNPSQVDCSAVNFYNFYGEKAEFFVYSHWYYEDYGSGRSRFFGTYVPDSDQNRLSIVTGPSPGDTLVVTYESLNNDFKVVPNDVVTMVTHKVLHRYYIPTDKQAAQMHWDMFRKTNRMFKRKRTNGYSYDEYIDMFTSEYRSTPSP